ncbi:ABC transporter substrate-binding protein [Paenibacillus gansuensis]|uniref:ABC transporter substrate-binding protein n=1 Tax=Paenibacillus gansuensis TaxID=306542 RepID=A0ABW5P9A4_9BACL
MKKWITKTSLLLLSAVFVLSACSSKSNNTASPSPAATSGESTSPAAETLSPANLTWYITGGSAQPDQQVVTDEINKYLEDKLPNTTLEFKFVDFGSYDQKLNPVIAANETFDMMFITRDWLQKYEPNVKKGALLDITDLLEKHAPNLRHKIMPESFWEDMKAVDGKIYAVPNYQIAAKANGFVVQKRFADKYNLDPSKINKLEDMEPFFEAVKKGEQDITPFINKDGFIWFDAFEPSTWIYKNDKTYKQNVIEFTPEYKKLTELARSWYTKGYINEDAATIKSLDPIQAKGNWAAMWNNTLKPGGEVEIKAKSGGNDVIYVPLDKEPVFTGVSSAMTAISKTSKHPERALMFLDLLNTDPKLFNLVAHGIEGKHYTKVKDNYVQPVENSAYNPATDWVFGNQFIGYLTGDMAPDVWEKTKKLNESAVDPITRGFVFNSDPVKAEVAALNAIMDEYNRGMLTGTLDPAKYLPIFTDKLKAAGREKILAEEQKQLDEFFMKKGLK